MQDDRYFAAESKRRKIAELKAAEEAAEREAAKQRHLEEMRAKPHGLPKGNR